MRGKTFDMEANTEFYERVVFPTVLYWACRLVRNESVSSIRDETFEKHKRRMQSGMKWG